jgi:hypothetical protein
LVHDTDGADLAVVDFKLKRMSINYAKDASNKASQAYSQQPMCINHPSRVQVGRMSCAGDLKRIGRPQQQTAFTPGMLNYERHVRSKLVCAYDAALTQKIVGVHVIMKSM